MKRLFLLLPLLCVAVTCNRSETDIEATVIAVTERAPKYIDPRHYAGTVYIQALAELYRGIGDERWMRQTCELLDRFASGELRGYGSFISYECGGSAVAEMAWMGFDKYKATALEAAQRMFDTQPRNDDGVMLPPWPYLEGRNGLFIDPVFAVTPYLLYAGLAAGKQEWTDYAAWMTLKTFSDLRDHSSGLVHQARAINDLAPGQISQDCWSRGNGWGAMALAALMRDLPRDNTYYQDVCNLALSFFEAVLKYQDAEGLWHQEMTWPDSFTEISGSALLLYGLGAGIESGVLPRSWRPAFKKGIAGLVKYIDERGNVANTCSGCLAYRDGSKEAYASHDYYCNEKHAFGPVLLALGQALRMGLKKVNTTLGASMAGKALECVVMCVEDRKADIAWENDRAAFRIYSQQVKNKVSSGVDYWAKRVDYPILASWYAKDAAGGSYHEDDGEGCDFYNVGKNRGVGGIGVWTPEGLLVPEPYESFAINYSAADSLSFTVSYPAIVTKDDSIVLRQTISMKLSAYYYRASVSAETASGNGITIAAGLSTFGAPQISRDESNCSLNITEQMGDFTMGSSIVAKKSCFKGFASSGSDALVLLDLPAESSADFFAGAAWSKDSRFDPFASRWPRITSEATYQTIIRQ